MKWVFETGKEQTLLPSVYPVQSRTGRSVEENQAFDQQSLMERVDYDEDLLATIVMMFECDAPLKLSEIEVALANQDSSALENTAHALKGMLLNFSAREAAANARALEVLGRSQTWTNAPQLLSKLRRQIDDLHLWLNLLLERQAS